MTNTPGHALQPTTAKVLSLLATGLHRLEGVIARRPGWAVFGAGAVSTLAMPPVFAWPVLFVTLFVLIRALDGALASSEAPARQRVLRAARIGWLFGFGYFVFGLYWINASLFVEADRFIWLLPFSATLIPAGLALFFAAAAASLALPWNTWRGRTARVLGLAIAIAVAEWLRGHLFTGLPWIALGYALTAPPLLLQSASLVGVYGLTFLTVLLMALPATALDAGLPGRRALLRVALPLLGLAGLAVYGALRLTIAEPPVVAGVRLRLLQPNVSQHTKWRSENRAEIFKSYLDRSVRDAAGKEDGLAGITHVIWPESAIPFLLLNTQGALDAIAGVLPERTLLLTGAIRLEETDAQPGQPPQRRLYNSILALDGRARLAGVYDKLHLVPFGEYLPFQRLLEAIGLRQLTQIQGGFSAGVRAARYWEVPGLPPMSPLVCYESIFPDQVTTPGRRPAFFLNVTNDGWFGRTAGPHQHFHQSRVRSVEQGLPLVRSANTGVSAVIDARGRVRQSLGLDRSGVIDAHLPGALAMTPYARWGETGLLLMLLCAGFIAFLRRNRPGAP